MSNSPSRSRGAFLRPGFASLLHSPRTRGGRSAEKRSGAAAPVGRALGASHDAGRSPLGAPPWRFWASGPRFRLLRRPPSYNGGQLPSGSVQRAPRSQVVVPGGRGPGPPGASGYKPPPQDATPRSAFRMSPETPLDEQGCVRSSTDTFRSQEKYSICSRGADGAGGRDADAGGPQGMPATTEFLGRETPLESVRRRRFNPSTARARAGKPTREEQHGQGSDAQYQGKEEAEGGVEQEEERRPHPVAVRVGTGAGSAGPESVRQEELAERPIDGAALHPFPFEEARSVKAGGHRARATPQQSSGLLLSDAGMFSTSGDIRDRPDRPTSPNPCGCRGRRVRDRAPGYTLQ